MKSATNSELVIPSELTVALKQSPEAKARFDELSPSCRREYLEWISSAKKAETRARRVEKCLAMLTTGR